MAGIRHLPINHRWRVRNSSTMCCYDVAGGGGGRTAFAIIHLGRRRIRDVPDMLPSIDQIILLPMLCERSSVCDDVPTPYILRLIILTAYSTRQRSRRRSYAVPATDKRLMAKSAQATCLDSGSCSMPRPSGKQAPIHARYCGYWRFSYANDLIYYYLRAFVSTFFRAGVCADIIITTFDVERQPLAA